MSPLQNRGETPPHHPKPQVNQPTAHHQTPQPAKLGSRGDLWNEAGEAAEKIRAVVGDVRRVVVVHLPNSTSWLVMFLAVLRAGHVPATPPVITEADHLRKSQGPLSGQLATTPDLRLSRGFREDSTILGGGTPQLTIPAALSVTEDDGSNLVLVSKRSFGEQHHHKLRCEGGFNYGLQTVQGFLHSGGKRIRS